MRITDEILPANSRPSLRPKARLSKREKVRITMRLYLTLTLLFFGGWSIQATDVPEQLKTYEVRSVSGIVVANTYEAAAAGAEILGNGGNAIDAAVATSLALGVTEPEATSIGGQAWMLIHLANGRDFVIDGSAAVPREANPKEIRSLSDIDRSFGYKIIATPGCLAALSLALERYGTKSISEVIAPAIRIAEFGFHLSPHGMDVLRSYGSKLRESPAMLSIFMNPKMDIWDKEHLFCMDDLARTYRRIGEAGVRDFYNGKIAEEMVTDIAANGGYVRRDDLARMRAIERVPVRGKYRGYDIVSVPFPGGGTLLIEALQILDNFPREMIARDDISRLMLLLESVRIAYIDSSVPENFGEFGQQTLISPELAARRSSQIRLDQMLDRNEITDRVKKSSSSWKGTTNLAVIDHWGNAVTMTQTINQEFGACVATPGLGFPYNGTLALYGNEEPNSPTYLRYGNVLPNTIAPTFVLKNGKPLLITGGPGSNRITSTVLATITNVIDRDMSVGEAVSFPRVMWDDSKNQVGIEMTSPHTDVQWVELYSRGFTNIYQLCFPGSPINVRYFGGVNTIVVDQKTGEATGAGDPRRAGCAIAGGAQLDVTSTR